MPLSDEVFNAVFPSALKWAEDYQQFILEHGAELSQVQQGDARLVGVAYPERIRLLLAPHVPYPVDGILGHANNVLQIITLESFGATFFYGICLREDHARIRSSFVHECVHVTQHERFGGIEPFLRSYLDQCNSYGYLNAPLEQEAISITAGICGTPQGQ